MIKFGYFVVSGLKNRFAIIAIDCPLKDSNDLYKASIAFCSGKDNFSKKRGREIVSGRLKSGNYISIEPFTNIQGVAFERTVSDVIAKALEQFISNGYPPSWFVRAHKNKRLTWGLNKNKNAFKQLIEWKEKAIKQGLINVSVSGINPNSSLNNRIKDVLALLNPNGEDISEIECL